MNKNNVVSDSPALARVRRRRSFEEKFLIVEETLAPGASVAVVARRHGVNANQVFAWRRECRAGIPDHIKAKHCMPPNDFIKIGILEDRSLPEAGSPAMPAATAPRPVRRRSEALVAGAACWPVEVELRNGIRVRVADGTDEKNLRRILVIARDLA